MFNQMFTKVWIVHAPLNMYVGSKFFPSPNQINLDQLLYL